MRTILQIVPRRALIPDGIGDYSTLLAEGFLSCLGIRSVFLQGTLAEVAPPRVDEWITRPLVKRNAEAFSQLLSNLVTEHRPLAIVLHVSVYGYEERGVPFWLVRGLNHWSTQRFNIPLIAIFHELWVGPESSPLRSSFWLRLAQKFLVLRMLRLADFAITTTTIFQRRLCSALKHDMEDPLVLNVISNVGEPDDLPDISNRPRRLVVFGGGGIEELSRAHAARMREILSIGAIEEVIDIGDRPEPPPRSVFSIPVIATGRIDAAKVSKFLLASRFGILPYGNRSVLGKSGILAAYAAHGVVPIAMDVSHKDSDGLVSGLHYLVADEFHFAEADLNAVQKRINGWYREHALSQQVRKIDGVIESVVAHRR